MPTVKIYTGLPSEEHAKFLKLANDLRTSEYKLAQEAILTFVNERERSIEMNRIRKLAEWIIKDLLLET